MYRTLNIYSKRKLYTSLLIPHLSCAPNTYFVLFMRTRCITPVCLCAVRDSYETFLPIIFLILEDHIRRISDLGKIINLGKTDPLFFSEFADR
jgi:hypothetical protein